MTILGLLAVAWGIAALGQLVLWRISVRIRNAGIVDVGWAAAFAVIASAFLVLTDRPLLEVAPIAVMVIAWSVRLSGYLLARGVVTKPEEGRYAELRRRWSPHADRAFFVFFQAQALLVAVLTLAFVVPFTMAPTHGWLRVLGGASQLLLRVVRVDRLCGVRPGVRAVGADRDRRPGDHRGLDLRRHGHSSDGGAGDSQQGRRVPGLPAPGVEVHSDAAEVARQQRVAQTRRTQAQTRITQTGFVPSPRSRAEHPRPRARRRRTQTETENPNGVCAVTA
ncbi:MAG: DUF1295 domain-containing protein [Proteobacteria bacterium]|nr:DUF1295 domain-containing protein [Pseudomonadota bacterium]